MSVIGGLEIQLRLEMKTLQNKVVPPVKSIIKSIMQMGGRQQLKGDSQMREQKGLMILVVLLYDPKKPIKPPSPENGRPNPGH